MLAKAGQQHVIGLRGGCLADRDCFLAKRGRIGAKPTGALQGDRLGVERARQYYGAIELDELFCVTREFRQRRDNLAVRVENLRRLDGELGDRSHRGRAGFPGPRC
jgi:hypothetical protein